MPWNRRRRRRRDRVQHARIGNSRGQTAAASAYGRGDIPRIARQAPEEDLHRLQWSDPGPRHLRRHPTTMRVARQRRDTSRCPPARRLLPGDSRAQRSAGTGCVGRRRGGRRLDTARAAGRGGSAGGLPLPASRTGGVDRTRAHLTGRTSHPASPESTIIAFAAPTPDTASTLHPVAPDRRVTERPRGLGWSCTEKAAADEARAKSHHTRHRLEQELAELRNPYRTLTAAAFDTDAGKDSGDQAQRLELADDLARLSDRIHQIIEVLTGRVPPSPTDALPDGTQVVIRFGDGSTDTIQVATIPGDTVTRNSPL